MNEINPSNSGQHPSVLKGAAAGLVGGLVAAWLMNRVQALVHNSESSDVSHGAQSSQKDSAGAEPGPERGEGEDATERLASVVAHDVFDERLTEEQRDAAGMAIHYAFGAATGAFYGAVAEVVPQTKAGFGMPFGTAVWLFGDEMIVPALGLSKGPAEIPPETHLLSLASHLVYGLTVEGVRRAIRSHFV